MALDLAADLAVFFSPEDFGEEIIYGGRGGIAAIWDRATGDLVLDDGRVPVDTNIFHLPVTVVPAPIEGIEITIVRTNERFRVVGEPRLNREGTIWACEAEPD